MIDPVKLGNEILADADVTYAEVVTYSKNEHGDTVRTTYCYDFFPGSYEKPFRHSAVHKPLLLNR